VKKIKFLLSLFIISNIYANEYSFELFSGTVYNMKEDIVIRQSGELDIKIDNANLKSHPQTTPFYYGYRFSRWYKDNTAWEFEHIHQKLYIDNSNEVHPDVQKWEITDGFNFFTLNKAWKKTDLNLIYRLGGGFVIAHPDITVRNKTNHKRGNGALHFGEGYHLSGFVLQTSVQKIFTLNKDWFYSTELKITYAKANVPIADGNVDVQNRAIHLDFGIGYKF
jgi:hypothetical protein